MSLDPVVFKIAYSFLKRANSNLIRELDERGISPEEFFKLPTKELIVKSGIKNDHSFDMLQREEALSIAEREYKNIRNHSIQPLFVLDEDYPTRLAEIEDAPIIIYKLGEGNLESEEIASVVGTRRPTPYGVEFCKKLISDLAVYFPSSVIVSGLAYGIDSVAHRAALDSNLATVAVVAHGLNMIYPANHRELAKEILRKGGAIVSEYPFGVTPFKANFLARNRIVAALSDVTVIVESAIKGGAMSTANFAFSYSKDVAALPGRISDELSSGCNHLIRKQKASLITNTADLIELTGWKPLGIDIHPNQRNLFPELKGDIKVIYEILKFNQEPVQSDIICQKTGLKAAKVMSILGEMEFDGIIIRYPGNRYSIS